MDRRLWNSKLTGILALALLFLAAAGAVGEERMDAAKQWKYVVENGEATITKCDLVNRPSGDVGIPSELDGYPVTGIGHYMLSGLRLARVTIPDSVVEISPHAFHVTETLESIEVLPGNPVYQSIDGILFDARQAMLVSYPKTRTNEAYAVPEGTRAVGITAFTGCYTLTSIALPNSVLSIGDSAFSGCYGLTGIVIPGSVTNIGPSAFAFCTSMTYIVLMEGITEIGDWAFSNCRSVTNITIPASVTSIGLMAFASCESLTSVTIPASVASIGEDAFAGCADSMSFTVSTGSYAKQYAKENGIPYVIAGE